MVVFFDLFCVSLFVLVSFLVPKTEGLSFRVCVCILLREWSLPSTGAKTFSPYRSNRIITALVLSEIGVIAKAGETLARICICNEGLQCKLRQNSVYATGNYLPSTTVQDALT